MYQVPRGVLNKIRLLHQRSLGNSNSSIEYGPKMGYFVLLFISTVCLGSTNFLCLRWKLEQVNLLKMTQKLVSVIEMTLLYAAQYSFVLLRPKFEVKLSTQSADKWICMGKWPVPSLAIYFHQVVVVRFVPDLL